MKTNSSKPPNPKDTLQELANIGPKLASGLKEIGISTKEEFLKQDPYKVFNKMCKLDPSLCRCVLSSLVGAKKGVPWHLLHKQAAKEYEKLYPKHKWKNRC